MRFRSLAVWTACCLGVGFVVGAFAIGWGTPPTAQAAVSELPPIFQIGAELTSKIGDVRIVEIEGSWIRAQSLSALDQQGGDAWWIYVPAQPGAWRPGRSIMAPSAPRRGQ